MRCRRLELSRKWISGGGGDCCELIYLSRSFNFRALAKIRAMIITAIIAVAILIRALFFKKKYPRRRIIRRCSAEVDSSDKVVAWNEEREEKRSHIAFLDHVARENPSIGVTPRKYRASDSITGET